MSVLFLLKHGEQNRFLVGAVLSALGNNTVASPDCVRQIIREEFAAALSGMEFTTTQKNPAAVDTQDDLSILEDLELFG